MSVESKLEEVFKAYLNLARAELRPQAKPQSQRPIQLLETSSMKIRRLVEGIETSSDFGELVKQTLNAFRDVPCGKPQYTNDSSITERAKEIGHFFKRSRCYTSLCSGKDIDTDTTFRDLITEFHKKEFQVRRLIPLSQVGFSEEQIQFKGFEIRFSAAELNEICQNDVMEVFYDWNATDVTEIEGYWFIDLVRLESSRPSWRAYPHSVDDVFFIAPVREEFCALPKEIASVLEPLILYDWDCIDTSHSYSPTRCFGLDIPFVLEIADDLLHPPRSIPGIPAFHVGPTVEKGEEVFDLDYSVFFDGADLDSFHSFVTHMDSILTQPKSPMSEWHFLEVALLFLSAAFFSEGLQQLLLHITALEALFGEKKEREGLTNLLAKRLASVLGKSDQERKEIKKSFQDLYDLRSRLVHGDEKLLDQKTHEKQLREARNLARRTLVWFLNYVDHVLHETRHDSALPTREELLSVLDLKSESRERVKYLLNILPPDFPHKSDWLDQ